MTHPFKRFKIFTLSLSLSLGILALAQPKSTCQPELIPLFEELACAAVEIPPLTGPVTDQAGFFSRENETKLSQLASSIYAAGGPQIQVWTIPELQGEAIETVAIRAVSKWKLGRQDRDDGLLLVLAAREKRLRIEVGQGLEGIIPDIIASRQIEGILKPAMRAQSPATGVRNWMQDVAQKTAPDWQPDKSQFELENSFHLSGKLLFMLVFFLIVILRILSGIFANPLGASLGRTQNWSGHSGNGISRRGGGWGGGWGGGGGGFGGGSGGGGWGGGGGGFGGGGSSGGW